jgi:hypothetical protein
MKSALGTLCTVGALLLAGCNGYNVYEIRLEPTPDGIQRTFTGLREPGNEPKRSTTGRPAKENPRQLPEAELERLAGLYTERLTKGGEDRQSFRGTFHGKLPGDVGGTGTYRRIDTPLGSAHWYQERFRGALDPDAELFARRAAADRLADLAVGWFDEQMKGSPHHAAVRRFLHQDFRQDLRNVVVHMWNSYQPAKPNKKASDRMDRLPGPMFDAVTYLAERGYFESEGVFRFGGKDEVPFAELRRLLARKSGIPAAEVDAAFPFLAGQSVAALSVANYLRKQPEYEALRKTWKPDPERPEVTEPDPQEVLGRLAEQACDFGFIANRDELLLTLAVGSKPDMFNGTYDPDKGVVTWHVELPTKRELPLSCLAAWTVENYDAQVAIFGKIPCTGENLSTFAGLYAGLSAERQAEFSALLEGLKGSEGVKERLNGFRFKEPVDESTRDLQERLKKKLLDLL